MIKIYYILIGLFLLINSSISQTLISTNSAGEISAFSILNGKLKSVDSPKKIINDSNNYIDAVMNNATNWENIHVSFGGLGPIRAIDTALIKKAKYIGIESSDKFYIHDMYFLESNYLDSSIDYTISLLFENDTSNIRILYNPYSYLVAYDKVTKQLIWKHFLRCGFDVFSWGNLCGYQQPMLVLDGTQFLCIKNRKWLLLPFNPSKMVTINWGDGKEEVLKRNVYNLQVSPSAKFVIYEKGKHKKNKTFYVYDIAKKKDIKKLKTQYLNWYNDRLF